MSCNEARKTAWNSNNTNKQLFHKNSVSGMDSWHVLYCIITVHIVQMQQFIFTMQWNFKSYFLLWFYLFLISNFCRVLNVVYFVLGNSPVSEFYMPTFHEHSGCFLKPSSFHTHTHTHTHTQTHTYPPWRLNIQSVPKRRHIKFRRRGITQKKAYSYFKIQKYRQNTTKFIILYHFWTTCFDSLESSSGPLVNWSKTI